MILVKLSQLSSRYLSGWCIAPTRKVMIQCIRKKETSTKKIVDESFLAMRKHREERGTARKETPRGKRHREERGTARKEAPTRKVSLRWKLKS